LAQARLDQLQRPAVVATPVQGSEVQDPTVRRYLLGDTYQFVTKDGLTGVETGRDTLRVVRVENDIAYFDDGRRVYGQTGAIYSDPRGTYDPPWMANPPGEYQVGKQWNVRTTMRPHNQAATGWIDVDNRIVARERVTVPAGTYDTWRVDGVMRDVWGSTLTMTVWSRPTHGLAVKSSVTIRDRSGRITTSFTREMLSQTRDGKPV
jgi:hypothetical protein